MEKRTTFKIWVFVIILLLFIVGGYLLMSKYVNLSNNTNKNTKKSTFNDIRIDSSKDYIYFSDEETVEDELEIDYAYVNINFEDPNGIANKLNNKMSELKSEVKYATTNGESQLQYAHYPKYTINSYNNFISLICEYFTYDIESEIIYENTDAYVFDKYTGKLYTTDEILSSFDLTTDMVKEKIKTSVNDTDLINGEESLDTSATLANVSMNSVYIDKYGRLSISILVKSSVKDYNEVIILS